MLRITSVSDPKNFLHSRIFSKTLLQNSEIIGAIKWEAFELVVRLKLFLVSEHFRLQIFGLGMLNLYTVELPQLAKTCNRK